MAHIKRIALMVCLVIVLLSSPASTIQKVQASSTTDSPYVFLRSWSGEGDQILQPSGVTLSPDGNIIYVVSANLNRVTMINRADRTYTYTVWGNFGNGNDQFNSPTAIAVDSSGNVYVAGNNQINKYSSNGTYLIQWGSYGSGNGQFEGLQKIAVDSSGNVYAVDYGNNRIQKFTSNGTYLTQWGSLGSSNDQFEGPSVYTEIVIC